MIPVNGFGADEMMFQIGVDGARGVRRLRFLSMVQARHSSSPTVKNEISPSSS